MREKGTVKSPILHKSRNGECPPSTYLQRLARLEVLVNIDQRNVGGYGLGSKAEDAPLAIHVDPLQ